MRILVDSVLLGILEPARILEDAVIPLVSVLEIDPTAAIVDTAFILVVTELDIALAASTVLLS